MYINLFAIMKSRTRKKACVTSFMSKDGLDLYNDSLIQDTWQDLGLIWMMLGRQCLFSDQLCQHASSMIVELAVNNIPVLVSLYITLGQRFNR